jgi:hypothetical protein
MRDVDMSELNYPWDPLGTPQRPFSGELQGNGFSIKNLSITQASDAVNATSLDPLYNNTVAILTFNQSVDGSLSTYNEVVDLSPSQHNITYGPVAYADDGTVEGDPLYGTYLLCDGNASRWVDLDASTDFDFGTGDFCIEFWYRPSGFNLVQGLMASGSEFGPGWSIHQRRSNESYGLNLYVGGSIIIGRNMNGVVTLNDWNHAAFTREGTNLRLFVNGVQQGVTETDSTNVTSSGNFTVGNGRSAHNVSSYADMDEVRITKGAARYTTNFTPPTYSYDATIGSVAGLFSYIGNGAVIEQVGITDANINITNVDTVAYKGILAGSAQGPLSNDGGAVTVRNVYVSGTVDAGTDGAGGLIGHTGANVSSLYENTYSDVTVTGSGADVGGWAGRFDTTATYNDNFWNSDKTTAGVGTGGDTPIAGEVDSLTTAQLQVQSNYTNWDFDTVWQMPELKDNIGPAQLQNNIFGRVVNDFGASLETGTPQAVLWKPPNTATNAGNSGSEQSFRLYKGAIIEDQNPVTLGWENRRFIPAEQASALMTSGRRHRAFMVYDVEPNIIFNPATKIAEREVAYLVPETVVERGTGWPFAGGTSKYIAQVVGSAGGATQDAINITITNPRKIALTVEDPILSSMIVGSDDFLGGTSTATLNYFVGTTFNSPDDILGVTGIIGGGDEGGQVGISITRAYGGTIG